MAEVFQNQVQEFFGHGGILLSPSVGGCKPRSGISRKISPPTGQGKQELARPGSQPGGLEPANYVCLGRMARSNPSA
jgi:hypothetical protein